jgi:predicted glycosyltransferase
MNALRALFFSHDRRGLGHLRRTLLLADLVLDTDPNATVLIVTGSRMAHAFRSRPRMDYVKLPSVCTAANGEIVPTTLSLPSAAVRSMRERILMEACRAFSPDIVLLDAAPLGKDWEIKTVLDFLRSDLSKTAVVLSLRDIPDDPALAHQLWRGNAIASRLAEYDRILVHGDASVFDVRHEYELAEAISEKIVFCGYPPRPPASQNANGIRREYCADGSRLLVLTVGGGIDGASLMRESLQAIEDISKTRLRVVAIVGPEMPEGSSTQLRMAHAGNSRLTFLDFVPSPLDYFAAADAIICMGGYNTLTEILSLGKKPIVMPRQEGSAEQATRTRRFAELGLVHMLSSRSDRRTEIRATIEALLASDGSFNTRLPFAERAHFPSLVNQIVAQKRNDMTM